MTAVASVLSLSGDVITIGSLDWVDEPSGMLVGIDNFFTDIPAIDMLDITFDAHSVVIDIGGFVPIGGVLSFDFVTDHDVPEPATLALFVIALGGLGFMIQRRVV